MTDNSNASASAVMDEHREQALHLHLLEEEAMSQVQIDRNSVWPANTNKQYNSKQVEFFTWNASMGYTDEYVNDSKLVLFMTQIQNRQCRQAGRKKNKTNDSSHDSAIIEQDGGAPAVVGYHTLAAYTNAVMDIWRLQFELQQNPRIPIWPTSVKELLKQKQIWTVQMENDTLVDRGIGTMADHVNASALQQICANFFLKIQKEV